MSVALIIIYNHQYNQNIEKLEKIYQKRFSYIYHLVPFYTGDKSNVIPVYENSYYFQGYVAQGFRDFFSKDYLHYFFIADDLILNPAINENNYTDHLKLRPDTCFLPNIVTLHEVKGWWPRVGDACSFNIKTPGVDIQPQLPDYDTAMKLFNKFGLQIKPLRFDQIWKWPVTIKDFVKMAIRDRYYYIRKLNSVFLPKKYYMAYPIVGGYSDIFVISSSIIKEFCHFCGVFAAAHLFVEAALPTALVLSADKIMSEKELGRNGKLLSTKEDFKILEQFDNNLNKLLVNFPGNSLYIHPIKLSKWSYQT